MLDAWLRTMDIEPELQLWRHKPHGVVLGAHAGEEIQDGLEKRIKELGVDVRTGTKGYDLSLTVTRWLASRCSTRMKAYDIPASMR